MNISIKFRKNLKYSYILINKIDDLPQIQDLLNKRQILIVIDSKVNHLYNHKLSQAISNYENIHTLELPGGEICKSEDCVHSIINALIRHNFTRSDYIIAIGGGSLSDVVGFAASIYMRGLNLIIIPTTLLSAVDASVGGKTAINFHGVKNQIGLFYHPKQIIFCSEFLKTLEGEQLLSAYAEIIKYGIIKDKSIFKLLDHAILTNNYMNIVQKCVKIKSQIIKSDEADNSQRQILNMGHLIGHAIESSENYNQSHGKAIAIGAIAEARGLVSMGLMPRTVYKQMLEIYKHYGFDVNYCLSNSTIQEFINYDKHKTQNYYTIVLVKKIGKSSLCRISKEQFPKFIENATIPPKLQ